MTGNLDAEIYVATAAGMLELDLAPVAREAVAANLANLRRMAGVFMSLDLGDDVDPAPVFWP
ncbi:MAG: DUF4089 domain-containing protein [Caulobacteraceae bacterium]